MNNSDRGRKHVCLECTGKYYDLNREVVTCPICGAKPPAPEVRRAAQPAKPAGRATFWRYR